MASVADRVERRFVDSFSRWWSGASPGGCQAPVRGIFALLLAPVLFPLSAHQRLRRPLHALIRVGVPWPNFSCGDTARQKGRKMDCGRLDVVLHDVVRQVLEQPGVGSQPTLEPLWVCCSQTSLAPADWQAQITNVQTKINDDLTSRPVCIKKALISSTRVRNLRGNKQGNPSGDVCSVFCA